MKKIFIIVLILAIVVMLVKTYRKRIKYLKIGQKGKFIRDLQTWYNEEVVANLANWNDFIPKKLNVTGVFDEDTQKVLKTYLAPAESYTTDIAYQVMKGRLNTPFSHGGYDYNGYGYAFNNKDHEVYKFAIK